MSPEQTFDFIERFGFTLVVAVAEGFIIIWLVRQVVSNYVPRAVYEDLRERVDKKLDGMTEMLKEAQWKDNNPRGPQS